MIKSISRLIVVILVVFLMMSCSSSGSGQSPQTASSALNADPWANVESLIYEAQYSEAIDVATELIDKEGKSVRGLTLRGIAYAKFNKQYAAFDDLIEASRMDRNVDTLMNIGNALRMFGHCDRASDAYRQILAIDPNNTEAIINLTSSYLCIEDLERANETIQMAFANFPKDAVAYTNVAILKHLAGDAAEARAAAEKATQADEDYVPAWQALYRACVTLNDKTCSDNAKAQHNSRVGARFKTTHVRHRSKKKK